MYKKKLTARLESQKALLKQAREAKEERERIAREDEERQFLENYGPDIRRIIEEIMDVADKNAQAGKNVVAVGLVCGFGANLRAHERECWLRILNILRKTHLVEEVGDRVYDIVFGPMEQTSRKDVRVLSTWEIRIQ